MSQNLKVGKTSRYPYALAKKKIENKQKNIILNQIRIGENLLFFKIPEIKSPNHLKNLTKTK